MPGGRPPEPVPQDIAEEICAKLREGMSLRAICREEGIPTIGAVLFWAQKDPEFAEQYARAREIGLEIRAEEIVEVADDLTEDPNSRRVRVDARKWTLSKQFARKYGDRQHVEHSGGVTLEALVTESFRREKSEGG